MVSEDYKVGDLVWAKMKGFRFWPAKIVEYTSAFKVKPPKHKKAHFVYFFGTENFAWILDENIKAHSEREFDNLGGKRTVQFQNAIDALINHLKNNKEKSIVPKARKEKPENEAKKYPQTKVVKVLNSISRKHERKVLSSKSPVKKTYRKRSLDSSINGGTAKCAYPKSRVYDRSDYPLVGSTPPNMKNSDLVSLWDGNQSIFDQYMDFNRSRKEDKHVLPSKQKIGFIGLGLMGTAVVKNLLKSGHDVTVWNKSLRKCDPFAAIGVKIAHSPAELVTACDITFCCVSDPDASKSLIFGDRGVLKGLEQAEKMGLKCKGYVEMTSIDPETSQEIAEAIVMKHGKYLEAPVCGNSKNASDGALLVLASGDRKLFLECETCFHAMGKHAFYISCDVGSGNKMSLLLSMISGTVCAAVAEAMVLAERLDLPAAEFIKILSLGPLQCDTILDKCKMMIDRNFKPITPLKHMQKDLNLALMMGNYFSQPMPVTAAANEVYKHARLLKYSDNDVSAVYQGVRY